MIMPYLLDSSSSMAYGLTLTLAIVSAQITSSLCNKHASYICFQVGSRVRTALVFAIFEKSLQIDSSYYRDHPIGQVTNLMGTDVSKIAMFMEYMILAVSSPVSIVLAIVYLWRLLGFASLGGMFFIVLSIPMTTGIAKWMGSLMMKLMKMKDDRVNSNQEVLSNMKIVKLQAWEGPFKTKSEDLRKIEVDQLFSYKMAGSVFAVVTNAVPMMVAVSSFGIYVTIVGHSLDAATALTSISVFNILNMPLSIFPAVLNLGIESTVCLERIQNFLTAPNPSDAQIDELEHRPQNRYGSINTDVENSNGVKDRIDVLPLRQVNFKCDEGDFVAVVGEVGSGKSTLLKSILGEVQKVSGEVAVQGSVAYFSQSPFIMNDTVKGNILFGRSNGNVDHDLYKLAVESACLEHDFKLLSDGDQTEIGEKGVNLSGGQKARIAIGRAVYRDADISLLDDCLSAVDAHVGRDLFDNCIVDVLSKDRSQGGKTRKRTVIFVTNAIQYLNHPKVDRILVLKDGLIVESGTYSDLVSQNDSHFKSMLETFNDSMETESEIDLREAEDIDESSSVRMSKRKSTTRKSSIKDQKIVEKTTKLITSEAEESRLGEVEWKVYNAWIQAAGGIWIVIPLVFAFTIQQLLDFIQRFWLVQFWGTSGEKDRGSQLFYLSVYALLYLVEIALTFFKSVVPVLFALKASKKFFSALLDSMLMAPMTFFDTTPVGRIVNRFSKDINTVDELLVTNFKQLMSITFSIVTSIVVLLTTVPQLSIILPFLGIFYKQQHSYFSRSNRELKRIDSTARSPIFNLFGEALNGYSTIRAFEAEPALSSRMANFLDKQQHAYYLLKVGNCWLGVRLEFLGTLLIGFGCLGFVLLKQAKPDVDPVFASMAGLALSYLLSITSQLLYAIRYASDFEASLVSVERIQQYIEIEKEAPHSTPKDRLLDKDWPSKGSIEFKDYKLRYRPGLPLVLKGLNIAIPSQAKVGIVGRTGAGKSTLMNALTRLSEPDSGKIILDGVDIATVGLTKLRSKIAIIPQDPVLFSGTIRTNMDPFNQHSDETLMDALGRVGLYGDDSVSSINSLGDKVDQDGSNFSAGQRQMLVIARALLGGSSVVICDEATSSIDAEADSRIQRVFREEFAQSTTLTIAHRLNTIMDSTHILVMADGKAVEFDSPDALLAKGGLFKDLVDKWGEDHE
eukprot:jgi/Psemu1/235755/estExt_Genewise1.C_340013